MCETLSRAPHEAASAGSGSVLAHDWLGTLSFASLGIYSAAIIALPCRHCLQPAHACFPNLPLNEKGVYLTSSYRPSVETSPLPNARSRIESKYAAGAALAGFLLALLLSHGSLGAGIGVFAVIAGAGWIERKFFQQRRGLGEND
jgi:hypothetical protein